jgi:hypothetical protein
MVEMMSVYASLAHAVMNEQLRPVLERSWSASSDVTGTKGKAWRIALCAYGKDVYTLGSRMGIPTKNSVGGHGYSVFTCPRILTLGISPLEVYGYKTITHSTTAYTPIHLATALLRFAPSEYRSMAEELLQPAFLRKYAKHQEPDVVSMRLNPYVPEELGLPFKHLPIEPGEYIDEVGNLAWFTPEYAHKYFEHKLREGFVRLTQLNLVHRMWGSLVESGAAAVLAHAKDRELSDYPLLTLRLRMASKHSAENFLNKLTGVRGVLNIVRDDLSEYRMKKGLSILATTGTAPVRAMFKFIGRKLTMDDLRELTPRQALEICFYAPLGAIEDLRPRAEELGAMFFGIKDLPMGKIQNVVSDHVHRAKEWYPCSDAGIARQMSTKTIADAKSEWDDTYRPLTHEFVEAYTWRNDLLEAVDPDTAFLGMMYELTTEEESVPRIAIDNLLRTHSNYARLKDILARMPLHLRRIGGLDRT